ncbi:MAG TPA: hypothetical protein VE954_22215 [Oligoflexus sp.]|uniref:hypothetical protein n=1 Tax=Oligoflexus sp. TaxID=1971216 RepID=UPI002D6DDAB3|nr:hypothetical protein [Oligoflexus sp.]HYX35823.1 hypothetical protein [Oligoflexus sp.]
MQLASVLLTPEETVQAVEQYFPDARRSIDRPFQFMQSTKGDPIYNKDCLLIIALCCPNNGIEVSELERIVGLKSMSSVNFLLDSEILVLDSGRLKLSSDYIFDTRPDNILKWMGYIIDLFDRGRKDEKGSFTTVRISGLNEKGIDRLHQIMAQAEQAIDEALGDKGLQGDISIGLGMISTPMKPKI